MPPQLLKLWFRYFDRPEDPADYVEVPDNASMAELRRSVAQLRLIDPADPPNRLIHRDIDIWQLDRRHRFHHSDTNQWKQLLKVCKGGLGSVATKLVDQRVDVFRPRSTSFREEYLSMVVSRTPLEGARGGNVISSLAELYPHRYQSLIEHQMSGKALTPSQAAESAPFRESQGKAFPIYDGRHPSDNGPNLAMPVSLYHPVFQTWLNWAFDKTLEPPAKVIAATAELMHRASILYSDEAARRSALCEPLQNALLQGVNTVVGDDLMTRDGHISIKLEINGTVRNIPILTSETKQNSASSTTDAATQASFSLLRAWANHELDDPRNLACCPTFLLGLSGCHLVICGAVLTDRCIVNRLAMMWVGRNSTHDEDNTIHIARVFYALSLAIDELSGWYKKLIDSELPLFKTSFHNHPRFFPFVTSYPLNADGDLVEFEYIQPLQAYSTCVTFLAEAKPVGSQVKMRVVVKFVQRYCSDVHLLLAAKGMAPDLLYCGQIDASTPYPDWKLVMMDFFNGKPSFENDRYKDPDVRQRVAEIVKTAHDKGFVLGDVRPPNVLVNASDEIRFIDFDWAGREGEVHYPAHMSTGLWVDGIVPMGVIEKGHDERMIDKWFG